MSYVVINTPKGKFKVDWDLVYMVSKSYHLSMLFLAEVKVKTSTGSLATQEIELPWDKVKRTAEQRANNDVRKWKSDNDIAKLDNLMTYRYQETLKNKNTFHQIQRSTHNESMKIINNYTENLSNAIEINKKIRNLSTSTLLIGATIVGGPAGIAIAGVGSLLTGVVEFQESGNLGTAVITSVGTLLVTIIPIGAADARLSKKAVAGALVILNSSFDFTGSLVAGEDIKIALLRSIPIVGNDLAENDLVNKILNENDVKRLLEKSQVSATVTVKGSEVVNNCKVSRVKSNKLANPTMIVEKNLGRLAVDKM